MARRIFTPKISEHEPGFWERMGTPENNEATERDVQLQILHELRVMRAGLEHDAKRRRENSWAGIAALVTFFAGLGLIFAGLKYSEYLDGVMCMIAPMGLAIIGLALYFASKT